MRIAVLQGSSQKEKNKMLFNAVQQAAPNAEVINFGVFEDEQDELTYVEASFLVGLLLDSGAVDFVVTGCSSGQGMMLACNAWPGVCCGYTPTPQDAFLFGRINGGNAVSLPLESLTCNTLCRLFSVVSLVAATQLRIACASKRTLNF